jgi:hypothetical protein
MVARFALIAASVGVSLVLVEWFGRPYNFFDLRIYHGAMVWWSSGGNLYQYIAPETTLGFTYPPFAALVMRPMALLPMLAAGWVNLFASLAALAFMVTLLVRPVARRRGWRTWFVVALVVPPLAATEPVRETLGFGQVNLLLAALVLLDLVLLRRGGRVVPAAGLLAGGALAGVGIGLATAVKITPGLFILYLLLSRQWRPAFVAMGSALGATILAWIVAGQESATYYTSILWDTGRVGVPDATPNQSLAGVLARLFDSQHTPGLLWLSFAAVVLAIGLSRAVSAHHEGDEVTAFTLVALTANAVCPISWSHHLVFVVLAVLILLDAARRRRLSVTALVLPRLGGARLPRRMSARLAGVPCAVAGIALFVLYVVSPIWKYEHKLPLVSHYADGLWGVLMENSLGLAVLVLIAALPWRAGALPVFPPHRVRGSSPTLQYRP